jgi:hypothetical protein
MSTESRPPQLSLDEMRRLKWLLGGSLALVSLWTVFFLDVEALALVGVAAAVIAATLIWPHLPARLPALVWRLSVPAIIVAVAADFYFSNETLPVLIRLAVLLVLYRAVSYRRRREDLQLILLGLFLIVVAGVLTVSLGFACLLLLFTACTLCFLFAVTLIDAVDTGPTVMRPEEMREVPTWARGSWTKLFTRLRQVADWRLLALAGALFVLVVGLSALLFLVIPRFELATGFFLDRYITRKSHTGFSETVRFGDVGELVKDENVAMRVDLADVGALRDAPYWRLVVLDEYLPSGFRLSTALKNELIASQRATQILRGRTGAVYPPSAVGGLWTFYVEAGVSRFLPLPGSFGNLRLREPMPVQTSPTQGLVAIRTESMAMMAFQLEGVVLDATLRDPGFARLLRGGEGPRDERHYDPRITLRGPIGSGNQTALADIVREITAGRRLSAAEFTNKATEWIRAHHAYALSARIPRGPKDDIVKWLESREPGFCEHFAAALTVLCRAAGHPARVVAGFHGGTLNAFENYFMVKNSDAHAWAEVFDGEGTWFRADPTPGENAVPGAAEAAAVRQEQDSSWSARFDSLRVLWYRRIVNFDSRQQVQMIEDVKSFTSDTGAALRARLEAIAKEIKAWLAGPWDLRRAAKAVGLLAGVLAAVWGLVRAARWGWLRWRQWRRPGEFDPVRREAGRWLVRLQQPAGDKEQVTSDQPGGPAVVADLLRLRFGRRETWPEPGRVFKRARRARRAARRGTTLTAP